MLPMPDASPACPLFPTQGERPSLRVAMLAPPWIAVPPPGYRSAIAPPHSAPPARTVRRVGAKRHTYPATHRVRTNV